MTPTFDNGVVRLYQGDCREVIRKLPAESVQTCVTSPPYWGLRDYGLGDGQLGLEPTIDLYVDHMVEVFRDMRRVLRDDGTVWLNMGDSYAGSWGAMSYPGGSIARRRFGAGDNGNIERPVNSRAQDGLKPKDLCGIPWRVAFALQADGWWLRSDIVWSKPNPMPESVTDRPTRAHEYVFLLSKSARYYYDAEAIRDPTTSDGSDGRRGDGASYRFKPTAPITHMGVPLSGRNKRSVWEIATEPYPDAHFATFPQKLVEPCILAGTPARGSCSECGAPWERVVESWRPACGHDADPEPALVLDPFVGSGTTAFVAQRLGRRAIGIDLSAEYLALAEKRLRGQTLPMELG